MPINFHIEDTKYSLPDKDQLEEWLVAIARAEEKNIIDMTYIFCSDEYLLQINRDHLNHDYYTDIITFPYKQGHEIESDIFISVDRVRDNAATYGVAVEREMLRVISHGLLHLMGYKDKSEDDVTIMRSKEDKAIAQWYAMQ